MRASSILSRSPISSVIALLQRFEPLLVPKPKRSPANLPNTGVRRSDARHRGFVLRWAGPRLPGAHSSRRRLAAVVIVIGVNGQTCSDAVRAIHRAVRGANYSILSADRLSDCNHREGCKGRDHDIGAHYRLSI